MRYNFLSQTHPFALPKHNTFIERTYLSYDVYSDQPSTLLTRNWHPHAAIELGLPSKAGNYQMLDGQYVFRKGYHDAQAWVASGVVDGLQTLTIAFEGSELSDSLDFPHSFGLFGGAEAQYREFSPLRDALVNILANQSEDDYDVIYITGHSLGGAMAQFLERDLSAIHNLTAKIKTVTFGSIGAYPTNGLNEDRKSVV